MTDSNKISEIEYDKVDPEEIIIKLKEVIACYERKRVGENNV